MVPPNAAAEHGLPYAFASHFAPDALEAVFAANRERFEPSEQLELPTAEHCVNVIVADTDAKACRHFTTVQQAFVGMIRGRRGLMQPAIDDIELFWSPMEMAQVERMLACSFAGSLDTPDVAKRRG